ncbi:glycosyltransferase family 4 protein [Hyphococcus sp.]|uniref:glycosyltransferase family 4 protein n=1 Tax=Hyphococcus sp. TaxID=2038636 RepID=UPI003D09D703
MAQNGIATYVDVMTRALERRGHECVVIAMWPLGENNDPRMRRLRGPRLNGAEKLLRRVRGRIEGEQTFDYNLFGRGIANSLSDADAEKPVDIIEAEESFGLARYCVGASGAKVIVRSHGPHFLVHQGPFERGDRRRVRKEGRAFRDADGVCFPSGALRDAVAAHYGATFPVSAAYPNPIDIPPEAEAWSLDGCDRNTILFVGRFDAVKGADVALKAFERVAENRPGIRLVMAGVDHGLRGPDGEVRKFDEYVRANVPERLRPRIDFLGPVPRNEVPHLRRRALINLTASRYETFPYAVTEALALGAPVVSTATPGLAEYMSDDEDILFAPVRDAETLAWKISSCLEAPERAAQLGAAGRATAERLFSPDAVADQAEAFYGRIASRTPQLGAACS